MQYSLILLPNKLISIGILYNLSLNIFKRKIQINYYIINYPNISLNAILYYQKDWIYVFKPILQFQNSITDKFKIIILTIYFYLAKLNFPYITKPWKCATIKMCWKWLIDVIFLCTKISVYNIYVIIRVNIVDICHLNHRHHLEKIATTHLKHPKLK
jgi:hypothetical protein